MTGFQFWIGIVQLSTVPSFQRSFGCSIKPYGVSLIARWKIQQGGHRQHPGRHRARHHAAPIEVPQQYRRTRSPCRQTGHAPHARIQKLSLCQNPHFRYRNHAYDSQKPTGRYQRSSLVCWKPVLLTRILFIASSAGLLGLMTLSQQNLFKYVDEF